MITRTFNKEVLMVKLLEELSVAVPLMLLTVASGRSGGIVVNIDAETITPDDDQLLADTVNAHVPTSSFLDQQHLTDERNKEGFELYKKMFAHISDTSPVGAIDPFLAAYPSVMIFRCLMKDGQGESALRHLARILAPMGLFPSIDLYKTWVREFCKKYNAGLNDAILDMIETEENF
jgi:hypothetical protein